MCALSLHVKHLIDFFKKGMKLIKLIKNKEAKFHFGMMYLNNKGC